MSYRRVLCFFGIHEWVSNPKGERLYCTVCRKGER